MQVASPEPSPSILSATVLLCFAADDNAARAAPTDHGSLAADAEQGKSANLRGMLV